jgi:hypothetical protein
VVNTWVTRWHDGQIVEARIYTDTGHISDLFYRNEVWSNSNTYTMHDKYVPGPFGMPDLKELEGQLGYPDGRKYESF